MLKSWLFCSDTYYDNCYMCLTNRFFFEQMIFKLVISFDNKKTKLKSKSVFYSLNRINERH
jgi:hypothetical protein